MKQAIFLVIVAVSFVGAHRGPQGGMRKQMEDDLLACRTSESPTDADMELFNTNQIPTSNAGKCFVGCMFERMGFIINGVYSRSAADAHAKTHMANKPAFLTAVLNSNAICEAQVKDETDKCVTGPKLMQCLESNLPTRPPRV